MAALLSLLIDKHGQKKGVTYTRVELFEMVLKNVKQQKRQIERGESCSYVKKHSSYYFTVAVKSSGDISAEPVRGQKIEEHSVTDLDLCGPASSLVHHGGEKFYEKNQNF